MQRWVTEYFYKDFWIGSTSGGNSYPVEMAIWLPVTRQNTSSNLKEIVAQDDELKRAKTPLILQRLVSWNCDTFNGNKLKMGDFIELPKWRISWTWKHYLKL